jgi:hypothetical protein
VCSKYKTEIKQISAPVKMNTKKTMKNTCNNAEGSQNPNNSPRWPWSNNQMGNPECKRRFPDNSRQIKFALFRNDEISEKLRVVSNTLFLRTDYNLFAKQSESA